MNPDIPAVNNEVRRAQRRGYCLIAAVNNHIGKSATCPKRCWRKVAREQRPELTARHPISKQNSAQSAPEPPEAELSTKWRTLCRAAVTRPRSYQPPRRPSTLLLLGSSGEDACSFVKDWIVGMGLCERVVEANRDVVAPFSSGIDGGALQCTS